MIKNTFKALMFCLLGLDLSAQTENVPGNFGVMGDLIFGNKSSNYSNNWIIHTPDDGRRSMYISPWDYKETSPDWDWGKGIILTETGKTIVLGSLGVGTIDPGKQLEIRGGDDVGLRIFNGTANVYWDIMNSQYGKLDFIRRGNNLAMQIDQLGNVGINTVNIPSGYKLAINGNAIAEKVVVRKNANWPDYVFEKGYKLPTLYEVDKFINEHKHLPEIPSAQEIEANGQDLGEMNRLLLKKVEELTLYILDQREELNQLRSRVQYLEIKKNK